MQRQVLVIQQAPRTGDVPLLQYIDTTVDVPVAKRRGLHDEVQRNQDGQEAAFCLCSGPRTRSRLSSTAKVRATCVSEFATSREAVVMRCATLTTPAKTDVRRRSSRLIPGGPSEPFHRSGSSSAPWSATATFLCQQRVPECTAEQIFDVLVPLSILGETVAVMKVAPQERVRQRTVEQRTFWGSSHPISRSSGGDKRRRCCVDGNEIKLNTVLQQHASTRVSRITFVAAADPLRSKWHAQAGHRLPG